MSENTWDRAKGKWKEILPQLGVEKRFLSGRNMACPACGGKDRFRYTDRSKDGDYYCNGCGAGKGIKLVMRVNGWDFKTAAGQIDHVLGYHYSKPEKPDAAHQAAIRFFASQPDLPEPWVPPKATQQVTLWLGKFHPGKLEAWLNAHPWGVRWWWEREGKKLWA